MSIFNATRNWRVILVAGLLVAGCAADTEPLPTLAVLPTAQPTFTPAQPSPTAPDTETPTAEAPAVVAAAAEPGATLQPTDTAAPTDEVQSDAATPTAINEAAPTGLPTTDQPASATPPPPPTIQPTSKPPGTATPSLTPTITHTPSITPTPTLTRTPTPPPPTVELPPGVIPFQNGADTSQGNVRVIASTRPAAAYISELGGQVPAAPAGQSWLLVELLMICSTVDSCAPQADALQVVNAGGIPYRQGSGLVLEPIFGPDAYLQGQVWGYAGFIVPDTDDPLYLLLTVDGTDYQFALTG